MLLVISVLSVPFPLYLVRFSSNTCVLSSRATYPYSFIHLSFLWQPMLVHSFSHPPSLLSSSILTIHRRTFFIYTLILPTHTPFPSLIHQYSLLITFYPLQVHTSLLTPPFSNHRTRSPLSLLSEPTSLCKQLLCIPDGRVLSDGPLGRNGWEGEEEGEWGQGMRGGGYDEKSKRNTLARNEASRAREEWINIWKLKIFVTENMTWRWRRKNNNMKVENWITADQKRK